MKHYIAESELIINADGSVFHLPLRQQVAVIKICFYVQRILRVGHDIVAVNFSLIRLRHHRNGCHSG